MSKVLVIAGSESDKEFLKYGTDILEKLEIKYDIKILSAHRNLKELTSFLENLDKDYKVIIAVAGLSAALPGIVASLTALPVIGVPRDVVPLNGIDALLSIVQMPSGVPVATMGVGKHGMKNAAYLAKRILDLLKS